MTTIYCWFYVKNCIFQHMTDKILLVTAPSLCRPLRYPLPLKVEVLEPPSAARNQIAEFQLVSVSCVQLGSNSACVFSESTF